MSEKKEQQELSIQQVLDRLEKSDQQTVPIEDVRQLVKMLRDFFEGNFENHDAELFGDLGELAKFINGAQKELREFSPGMLKDEQLPEASDQLDAIVKTTEQATGRIMDACEQIQLAHDRIRERLDGLDMNPDTKASVEDALSEADANVTNVYEACNFQDITGQRILKIVEVLKEIERQVLRMVIVFGLRKDNKAIEKERRKKLEEEAALLNGPQKPGESLEQDDVDDILDALL